MMFYNHTIDHNNNNYYEQEDYIYDSNNHPQLQEPKEFNGSSFENFQEKEQEQVHFDNSLNEYVDIKKIDNEWVFIHDDEDEWINVATTIDGEYGVQ